MSVTDRAPAAALEGVRVLVLEDHPLFLDALCHRLGRLGCQVAGTLQRADRLLEAYDDIRPDLVLVDLSLPDGGDGAQVTEALVSAAPDATVVVLSAYDDELSIARCLDAGAAGFISKRVDADELAECLQAALRGEPAFDRRSARTAITVMRQPDSTPQLSAREVEILQQVADGASTADIARALHLSPFTVKAHIAKTLSRLGAPDRAAAVAAGLRAGLIR